MEKIKKLQMSVGGLVAVLFLAHVILMTLLLVVLIPYSIIYTYAGIALVVIMVIHTIINVFILFSKQEPRPKFYVLKWITGIISCLILTIHGSNYMQEVDWLCFHFKRGAIGAVIETIFLILIILHIRVSVDAMCNQLDMDGRRKLLWSRISCGIATALIVFPGIAIWSFFV